MHSKVKPTVFRGATSCCRYEQNFEVYKQLKNYVPSAKKIKNSLLLRNDRILLLDKNKRAAIIFLAQKNTKNYSLIHTIILSHLK